MVGAELDAGIVMMITERGIIIGGGVAAGVTIGMSVTGAAAGTEIIVAGARAEAGV